MKVKIEFDVGEAVRISGESIYPTINDLLIDMASGLSQPGEYHGDIYAGSGLKRSKVGQWEIE